jgi:hypothetical protein
LGVGILVDLEALRDAVCQCALALHGKVIFGLTGLGDTLV